MKIENVVPAQTRSGNPVKQPNPHGQNVLQMTRISVCFTKRHRQGNAEARFSLGVMYFGGEGIAQDKREAVSWYQKAAERGYAKAQYNLGLGVLEW